MIMEDVETTQIRLEGTLYKLAPKQLDELAVHLEVPLGEYTGKSHLTVIGAIRTQLAKTLDSFDREEEKKKTLLAILNFIADEPPPLDGGEDSKQDVKPAAIKDIKPPVDDEKSGETEPKPVNLDMSKLFRRDFKIKGQISSPGEGNQLSFISLARQIESAISKGYQESEVVDAVIQAISPGLPLRSYLESTPELELPRLRQILRSHYRERNATELYQQLASITQSPAEDPQTFLMRALDLRQKILFASKEDDVAIKYDYNLIQRVFLHSIDMGLFDDGVRARMQSVLKKFEVTDDELIREMNVSVSMETERKNKLSNKQSPVKALCSQPTEASKATSNNKDKVNPIENLKAEIESLRGSVNALVTQQKTQSEKHSPSKSKLCSTCQTNGVAICNHCYYCGSTDHFARGCRKKPRGGRTQQENSNRLPPRDRQ